MRILVTSLLSIFLFSIAYGDQSSNEQVFTDSAGYNCFQQGDLGLQYACLNYNKIKKIGHGKKMAWSKFIFNTPQFTSTNQTYYSYVSLDIYDCINDQEGNYQQTFYDANGNVVSSLQAPSFSSIEYSYNGPGTIGDIMQGVVCSKK